MRAVTPSSPRALQASQRSGVTCAAPGARRSSPGWSSTPTCRTWAAVRQAIDAHAVIAAPGELHAEDAPATGVDAGLGDQHPGMGAMGGAALAGLA